VATMDASTPKAHKELTSENDREQLAEMATARHGFGDSDGGFGVIYPTDLDEYDCGVAGEHIPEGYVEVYLFGGPPEGFRYHIEEQLYLELLEKVLWPEGHQLASNE
jgi:hypothetical protein